jgi:hypothetical protein
MGTYVNIFQGHKLEQYNNEKWKDEVGRKK